MEFQDAWVTQKRSGGMVSSLDGNKLIFAARVNRYLLKADFKPDLFTTALFVIDQGGVSPPEAG